MGLRMANRGKCILPSVYHEMHKAFGLVHSKHAGTHDVIERVALTTLKVQCCAMKTLAFTRV